MTDIFTFNSDEHESYISLEYVDHEKSIVFTSGWGNVDDAFVLIDDDNALRMANSIIAYLNNKEASK